MTSSSGSFSSAMKVSSQASPSCFFETAVDQLDVDQVVHVNSSPLNVANLKQSEDREGDLSNCRHGEILLNLNVFSHQNLFLELGNMNFTKPSAMWKSRVSKLSWWLSNTDPTSSKSCNDLPDRSVEDDSGP